MYHINPKTKDVSPCHAEKGNCPFDDGNSHFEKQEDAYLEAERRLDKEFAHTPLTKPRMVQSFEEWKAEKDGQGKMAPSVLPLAAYQAMLPVQHGELAGYCKDKGLTLEETQQVASILKRFKNPLEGGPSVLVTRALQERIKEASNYVDKLDAVLEKSFFFAKPRIQKGQNHYTLSTYATVGNEDFITHVSDNGQVKFEVYEHETGESSYASSPTQFIDNGEVSVNTWLNYYNSYRENIWLRLLWEREKRNRVARAGSLNL